MAFCCAKDDPTMKENWSHIAEDHHDLYPPEAIAAGTVKLEKALPIVYTMYANTGGKAGPELRAIVKHGDPAPVVTGTQAPVQLRGAGRDYSEGSCTKADHLFFPVDVYYVKLDMSAEHEAGELTFAGRLIPKITSNPRTWAVLGDTGLRVKADQCQSLADWPASKIAEEQAARNPDVTVHMGDYIYREGPGQGDCEAINATAEWGDTILCWLGEFFEPFKPLLDAAPMIAARGNHENGPRMGPGWHFLMGTDDWDPKNDWTKPDDWCPHNCTPFAVEFQQSVVYVVDNGWHTELSIDHYDFKDAHEAKQDWPIKIDPTINFAVKAAKDDELLTKTYMQLSAHAALAHTAGKVTFLLQHMPAFAVVCHGKEWVGYNPNVQKCFWDGWKDPNTLCAILSGHMHWYQRWSPKDAAAAYIPTQFVIGNGGTMLIPEYGVPPRNEQQISFQKRRVEDPDHHHEIEVNGTIGHGFGHSIFTQGLDGAFECVHYLQSKDKQNFVQTDVWRSAPPAPAAAAAAPAAVGWFAGLHQSVTARVEQARAGNRMLDEGGAEVEAKLLAKKTHTDALELHEEIVGKLEEAAKMYSDAAEKLKASAASAASESPSFASLSAADAERAQIINKALEALNDIPEETTISDVEQDAIKILVAKGHYRFAVAKTGEQLNAAASAAKEKAAPMLSARPQKT